VAAYASIKMQHEQIIPKNHLLQMRAACYAYHHPSVSFGLQMNIGDCEKQKIKKTVTLHPQIFFAFDFDTNFDHLSY
jgi:hypothetical protein